MKLPTTIARETVLKVIFWIAVGGLVFALVLIAQCSMNADVKTQADVNKGQAGAAQQTGKDAVEQLGTTMSNEMVADTTTKENDDEIRKAAGSDTAVAPDARAAGLRALCRRASFAANNPACVQQVRP